MGADLEKAGFEDLAKPTTTNAKTSGNSQRARSAIDPNLIRDEEVVASNPADCPSRLLPHSTT
jgi:hypothetical protein